MLASRRKRRIRLPLGIKGLEDRMLLSFGLTTTSSSFIVDTGAQVVFSVSKTNGDPTSIKNNGQELTAPFSLTNRYSHYESGLSSSSTVTASVNAAAGTATGVQGEGLSGLDLSGTTHTNAGTYAGDAWRFAGDVNYNSVAATPITDSVARADHGGQERRRDHGPLQHGRHVGQRPRHLRHHVRGRRG